VAASYTPKVWPPKTVVKASQASVKTVALDGSWLFDSVPMPKTKEPLKLAALLDADGSSTITPLLSVGKSATGFRT